MKYVLEESSNAEELFERMWSLIRGAHLYGGRPRNASSEDSVAVARRALEIATEANDRGLLAEARSMMAYALNANEEYVEALSFYREAIQDFEQIGDLKRAGRIRLGFIGALSVTGQSQEALEVGREAERLFQEQEDCSSLAKLATNLGAVHQRLDNYERAVQYHARSADLFKQSGDETALAQTYLNLGNSLCFLDRFAESEQMYAGCETIAARLALDDLRAHALYNKAYLYFLSGRYSHALSVYRDVRPLFVEGGSRRHLALCDLDEAEIYIQLRLPHDALLLAQAAAPAFAELDMPYEQGKAIAFAGVALTQKRQFGEAIAAFREAQVLLEHGGNLFWSALLDLYRAEVLFSIGRLWEAHSLASSADSKFTSLRYPAKRLVSLVLLGRVSMELGRLDEAEQRAQVVQEIAAEAETPTLFVFACHALAAEIAERQGRSDAAWSCYERAAREIEMRHTHLHHDELGITFYKGKSEVFESLAHLTLLQEETGAARRAFAWCEKSKSQMFVDALAPHLPSVRSRADEALLTRVERLRAELNGSYLRLQPEFRAGSGQPVGEAVELKEDELIQTLADLSKSDSEYVSLQSASSVRIEDLQASLPNDTTVIEYFFARDEVLAFVITKHDFDAARHLTTAKRVQYLAGRLQYQLNKFHAAVGHGRSEDSALLSATNELMGQFYSELLAAVMPLVRTGRLVIVPHGILHRLPFHGFYEGERYVAERYDVSYAPSGSVLKYCLDHPAVDSVERLIISAQSQSSSLRKGLKAHLTNMEASLALRLDNPVLSGFEFADGRFCIPDIYATRWETNLLVLSSVEGVPNLTGTADDLLGILRAFLYAGCRSILLELWKMRRDPSAQFLNDFYAQWLSGKSKAQAMRAARQTVQRQHAHPFHWMPFFPIGQL